MKNLPIIIGVVLILLLAVGGYLYMQKKPSSGALGGDNTVQEGSPASGMMSIKELMALGGNNMCTFSSSDENGTNQGTTYVSGQNIRTDFNGTYADGKAYEGHSIMDGSYIYTWTTDTEQGFKMAMTEDYDKIVQDAQEKAPESGQPKQMDPNEKFDFNCSGWNGDQSMFFPPSNIQFTDFSEQLKMMQDSVQEGIKDTSSDIKAQQCAACDNAPADSQAACRQALGCN